VHYLITVQINISSYFILLLICHR